MKKTMLGAGLVLLALGALIQLAPARAERGGDPAAVFLKYMEAIKENRFDEALPLLTGDEASRFFTISFRYANDEARSASPKTWNAAVKGKEEILKRLPYWRERTFTIAPVRTLVVGRNARLWFTYSAVGEPSLAAQDFLLEDGQWRLVYQQ